MTLTLNSVEQRFDDTDLLIDLSAGQLRLGAVVVELDSSEADVVLDSYLATLRSVRRHEVSAADLRVADAEVLGRVLHLDAPVVRNRLIELSAIEMARQRRRLRAGCASAATAALLVWALLAPGEAGTGIARARLPLESLQSIVPIPSSLLETVVSGPSAKGAAVPSTPPGDVPFEVAARAQNRDDAAPAGPVSDSAIGSAAVAEAEQRADPAAKASWSAPPVETAPEPAAADVAGEIEPRTGVESPSTSLGQLAAADRAAMPAEPDARPEVAPSTPGIASGTQPPDLSSASTSGFELALPQSVSVDADELAPSQLITAEPSVAPSSPVASAATLIPPSTASSPPSGTSAGSSETSATDSGQQLAPQQLAPQQLAPQQLAPQQLAPQQLAPQQLVPQQLAPQQLAAQEREPSSVPARAGQVVSGLSAHQQEIEGRIPWDFRSALQNWRIIYSGSHPTWRGLTNSVERSITIFERPGQAVGETARILVHELGHAVDLDRMNDQRRREWMASRGISTWWAAEGAPDFSVGAGDFAEAVAAVVLGSPSRSTYGAFSEGQLAFVRAVLDRP